MCVAPPVCLVSLFTRKQGLTVPKATAFPYYDLAHQTSNLVCALVVNFLVRGGSDLARSPISIHLRTAAWPCGDSGIGCEHSHIDLARSPNRRKASRRFGELSVICGHSHLDLERSGSTQCVRFGFAINGGKGLEVIDNRPRCQGIHNPCNHPRSRVEGTHRYDRPIASWAPYWRTSCVRDHGAAPARARSDQRQGLPVPTDGPGRRRLGQPAVLRDGRLRHRQRGKSSAAKMGFAN